MITNLLTLSRNLSKYVVGVEGNTSCKSDNGFYIKASGKSLKNLSEKDLVYCRFDGSFDNKNLRPSIETGFHSWIYKNLNANYIAHTHPINTLKILCSIEVDNFSKKRLFPDQVVFNGVESCLVDYYHPGDDLINGIEESVNSYIKKYNYNPKLILLKNHGIISFGDNINECIISTEICEKSAEIYLGSKNNPIYLSSSDIYKIDNDDREKYRKNLCKIN